MITSMLADPEYIISYLGGDWSRKAVQRFVRRLDQRLAHIAGKRNYRNRKIADLGLLDGNPLSDITNTKRIRGVMLGGKWIDRDELDNILHDVKEFHSNTKSVIGH